MVGAEDVSAVAAVVSSDDKTEGRATFWRVASWRGSIGLEMIN